MSPSRDGRHRFRQSVQCSTCGVPNEVEHIHWHCRKFAVLRAPIRPLLARILRAPPCFQYAALPTTVLVNIWQRHITEWHDGEVDDLDPDDVDPNLGSIPSTVTEHSHGNTANEGPQPAASSSSRTTTVDVSISQDQRGHRIRHFGSGAFCVKCGKQTARLQHLNARILKKPCPYANLPSTSWMTTPGKMQAIARLDQLELRLHQVYNKKPQHNLYWNRKVGKNAKDLTTYGRLWCRRCGRTFGWQYRHNNLPRTRCVPCNPPPDPPDWVPPEHKEAEITTKDATDSRNHIPRKRLYRKTAPINT